MTWNTNAASVLSAVMNPEITVTLSREGATTVRLKPSTQATVAVGVMRFHVDVLGLVEWIADLVRDYSERHIFRAELSSGDAAMHVFDNAVLDSLEVRPMRGTEPGWRVQVTIKAVRLQ